MAKELEFDGFQWDEGNRQKCRRHGVSLAEIEGLFGGSPAVYDDAAHSGQERRLRAIGPTNTGRYVFVAFTLRQERGKTLIRPISARYMRDKEVRHYERREAPQAHAASEQ